MISNATIETLLKLTWTQHEGDGITEDMIKDAAALFSNNYGIWGPLAESKVGSFAKQGRRVCMSPARLKAELLPPSPARNIYCQCKDGKELIGNVFATRWTHNGLNHCWITQLCLLCGLKNQETTSVYGILSSHPFAILATLTAFDFSRQNEHLHSIERSGKEVMGSCPVNYVRNACLHDSIFEPTKRQPNGLSYTADTGFFVDHTEPLQALEVLRGRLDWVFGMLPEGHEFVVLA